MRILLRLHLAPKREAHYKELVSRKAKEKQERKIKVDSAAIRNFQRNRLREEKKYLQNENRIVQAKDSDEEEKWSSRRYKCQQRIYAINENWQKRLKNQAQDRKNLQSDANEADNDDDTSLDQDSIKAAARWYRRRSIVEILEECNEEDSPDKDTPGIDEEQDDQKHRNDVIKQHISETCSNDFELQSQEIQAVKTIVNLLRPFVRESNGKQHRSIADALPFVVFANTVLAICGYQEFTTQISPLVSAGRIQSLTLDATSIYEMFISNAGRFNLCTYSGEEITNIRKARENKELMMGAFLDIDKMEKICNESGLIFQNRALLTSFGVIRLLDKRKHEKQACATYKTQISQGQDNDNIDIEALKTKIAELEAAYKLQQKERKRNIKAYEEAKSSLGTESLDILRDLRLKRAQAITDAENTATRLKDMRMMLYNITRSLKKKATGRDQEKAENTNTLPTLRHYACEESPSNIDISVLEKEAFDAGKTLGYSGTDYGLRTISTTVDMTQEKLQYPYLFTTDSQHLMIQSLMETWLRIRLPSHPIQMMAETSLHM
ncbi:hypothetical protein VTP01DRAFT_3735 [Rhizomucor pusillus]|uniref:uncharacterized protein n=1 Tax=Rhizomucor pusillus TaxID=4840 RepID=UPI003743D3CC